MKSSNYELIRYDADAGKVFDWKEPHYTTDIKNLRKLQIYTVETYGF